MKEYIKFVCLDNTLGNNKYFFDVNQIYMGYAAPSYENNAYIKSKTQDICYVTTKIENTEYFTNDIIIVRKIEIENILK